MPRDVEMQDADAADEERRQNQQPGLTQEDLDEKYPNRPHNHSKTLPFHILFQQLFNPLNDAKKKLTGPIQARAKQGPHGPTVLSSSEIKRHTIEKFFAKWRNEVGEDIYPAFRLIVPEKDRDRAMYGVKEKNIAKILIKVLKIGKDTEDGYNLLNWKLPGQGARTAMAGDFAGRCYEVISKRPMLTEVGTMTIADVNEKLDRLSIVSKEEDQIPIFQEFYRRMNADEMLWLVRIILRQMKIGATERTFFELWHPDAEQLFNVSSSLRRVCWELYDPRVRLDGDDAGITLMQCFQPQLAQFQQKSLDKVVAKMDPQEDNDVFWIEEKLDGERMQLHMMEDDTIEGGKRFGFWSRKAKDYTYLYGKGLFEERSAMTRHLRHAFKPGVRNVILDGEMITWDMEQDAIVPFGTLKTAALAEQNKVDDTGHRPVFRVFDCLFLNDQPLTKYTLQDRQKALEGSIHPMNRRLEIHPHSSATTAAEIEVALRSVVATGSEGLVIKNPRSLYRLNSRNDDWVKVKPEYMSEFGEELDCLIIGGYYGSGHRGGNLSSFMCGLKVNNHPTLFHSFFKVGGGFAAQDYAAIRHKTEGKWQKWDPKKPPTRYIELAGGDRQYERPDVWIKPEDSVVVSVKAAQTATSDQFRMGFTLRFPRFKKLRTDRDWTSALTIQGFLDLKANVEEELKGKKMEIDAGRKQRAARSRKKPVLIAGQEHTLTTTPYAGPHTKIFSGLTFHVLTESLSPPPLKKSKLELETLIKENGGTILANCRSPSVIVIADRRPVSVVSIIKKNERSIVRPAWLFDCVAQAQKDVGNPAYLLPYESTHLFHATDGDYERAMGTTDGFGDSYARDVEAKELRELFAGMPKVEANSKTEWFLDDVEERGVDLSDLPGWMFRGVVAYFDAPTASSASDTNGTSPSIVGDSDSTLFASQTTLLFAGGRSSPNLDSTEVTHIIIGDDTSRVAEIRSAISARRKIPRLVTSAWITESWKEKTLLDEERFAVR